MPTALRHAARPYAGSDDLVAACVETVGGALERDDRVLVLAGSDRLDDLHDGLATDAGRVTFVPTDEHARNPGRIATILHGFATGDGGSPALGVYDADLGGRRSEAVAEALLTCCLLNSFALRALAMSVVCLYNADELASDVLLDIRRAHPDVHGLRVNPDFDEALATALHAAPLPPAPRAEHETTVGPGGLSAARAFVRAAIADYRLAPDRADDLVLAVNEIVANSLRHGGGKALLSIWGSGGSVVCEVRDHGYLRDPMTGRLSPDPDATGGRGLWLVHHLCDLVQLRSSDTSGTVVRMWMDS